MLGFVPARTGWRWTNPGTRGITLIQRLEDAPRSPTPEYNGGFSVITSTPPQVPAHASALPVFFTGGTDADDEPDRDYQYYQDEEGTVEPAVVTPQSSRGTLDGLDLAFTIIACLGASSSRSPQSITTGCRLTKRSSTITRWSHVPRSPTRLPKSSLER